ncbi:UL5 [anatid alphaherpesvirus 1]|uniref:UL5 n=1 Tax=anatid alphaherpesvirus 1 TaxID=104388 RepID=B4XS18_9ALPH|nr:UL5 [Anatid alphaherpesvirus 1]ABU49255.1 UL5 [Anatid alphaherpesvirus 1]
MEMQLTTQSVDYPETVYLNFTSMHGIRPIVDRIRSMASSRVPATKIPPLSWFQKALTLQTPLDLELRELPFYSYLISGNAGSGKSTCIQTLNEIIDCVITGTTRVASQNVYAKLSAAYSSRHINTIFQEFGFRGNHVQAQLGKYQYSCPSTPPTIQELQKRDIVYYWDVLIDITRNIADGVDRKQGGSTFDLIRSIEDALCYPRGSLGDLAYCINGSLPSFTRSNVIIIDEAGLLGRHLLTAVIYCWWLINASYGTQQYMDGKAPVLVCVGSPTQTAFLESTFEHANLKCKVRSSENILTFLICNRTMRTYTNLPNNWSIFINNKRCREQAFGDLLKVLEYGLPITEEHARLVDNFVVPEAYINNPANLPGWTRLYSSHREVSAYMTRLHAHLKVSGEDKFVVFTLPSYTFVNIENFETYRKTANQPNLSVERWITANAGRLSNWSQSRDQDTSQLRCEVYRDKGLILVSSDITFVMNSQVAVTTRLKRWIFGFNGTFESFWNVLKDDMFTKTQGETSIEYAHRFLSSLMYSGLINFYNFLQQRGLKTDSVTTAYRRMAELTTTTIGSTCTETSQTGAGNTNAFDHEMYRFDDSAAQQKQSTADDDVVFGALCDDMIDMLYCNYDFRRPETTAEVYAQFAILKTLFMGRYAILKELFGQQFCKSNFCTYVNNVNFRGCEMFTSSLRGGMMSMALQTDTYTLAGYTRVTIQAFTDDPTRRYVSDQTNELLHEIGMPLMVLQDHQGFMSVLNLNICDFVDPVGDKDLNMATVVDYGLSSKLAMTIARSQGLGLEKVAICFSKNGLRLNSVYVAMSRVVTSEFLRMNINPLREECTREDDISEHILAALRDPNVHIVY